MPRDLVSFPEVETEVEPWRKVLLDAAQYIREHGWCQHRLCTQDGRVCVRGAMVGAINGSVQINDLSCIGMDSIREADSRLGSYLRVNFVPDWNNAPSRTAEEVIQAMEAAARAP